MKNFEFWAVVDKQLGVVTVIHEKYGEIKAIFATQELAQRCVAKSGVDGLLIRRVNIVKQ